MEGEGEELEEKKKKKKKMRIRGEGKVRVRESQICASSFCNSLFWRDSISTRMASSLPLIRQCQKSRQSEPLQQSSP